MRKQQALAEIYTFTHLQQWLLYNFSKSPFCFLLNKNGRCVTVVNQTKNIRGNSLRILIGVECSGWSRADLKLVYQFWVSQLKKSWKRKTNVLNKNKTLPSVTLLASWVLNQSTLTQSVEQNYHSTLIFWCFCQYLDKKVGTTCPGLSTILKILPLITNYGGTSGWPSTCHNSTNTHIRAVGQPLGGEMSVWEQKTCCNKLNVHMIFIYLFLKHIFCN